MPLHDWNELTDWETVHLFWIVELGRWIKPRLPAEYRMSLVTLAPDQEVTLAMADPSRAVHVTCAGNLVAVIELISPRNKHRPESRRTTTDRWIGYFTHGIHLLMVDVYRQPANFSFADDLAAALLFPAPALPAPCAVSYRMGSPAPRSEDGRLLAVWRRSLAVGQPLPSLPLPLTREVSVVVDLEKTYMGAAADAYLD